MRWSGWLWSMIRTSLWRLQEDEEVATRMCFSGFCADFKSHSHLLEKAEVEAKSIVENRFTRVSKVVDIVNALKDDNLNIRGMGVVGKNLLSGSAEESTTRIYSTIVFAASDLLCIKICMH
ncbi:hypothetical protein V6N13_051905 [Hibiscus sabdariffa]|uniref:Uncharacterized protein n=1 Tax=Hibiscus sabdariffa TaxID=183260 RepID=A0ABR2T5S8_9ROSI